MTAESLRDRAIDLVDRALGLKLHVDLGIRIAAVDDLEQIEATSRALREQLMARIANQRPGAVRERAA